MRLSLMSYYSVLQEQPLDDEEMEDDLIFVTAKLQEVEQTLSSYDEFCSEISTGRLQWSPVHTNGKFWRDNCHRFVEKVGSKYFEFI